jgi:hypothetical protein
VKCCVMFLSVGPVGLGGSVGSARSAGAVGSVRSVGSVGPAESVKVALHSAAHLHFRQLADIG